MALTRKSRFGFPPPANAGSQYTHRSVPLTQGVKLDTPWPLLPPGSTTSMSNFLPLDGVLVPRSRLSSLNTIRAPGNTVIGLVHFIGQANEEAIWYSAATVHGFLSGASISRASFVSAGGLGVAGLISAAQWQYAQTFMSDINNNVLVAAHPSHSTLLVLYHTAGGVGAAPLYSYLTSSPRAASVAAFDNYVVAFNVNMNTFVASTRVQWCVRGNPSNWTSEGSGFEDLLEMRGNGTAVKSMGDGRLILFSNVEIWYGVGATYPAQFQFTALDTTVGCVAPNTIAAVDEGLIFLGSDGAPRLLPRGGGPSQIISTTLAQLLRRVDALSTSWAMYDPTTRIYHLFVRIGGTLRGVLLNTQTGEWGYSDYNDTTPVCGVAIPRSRSALHPGNENLFFGSSTGTIYSTNSLLAQENGSNVTSVWRSAPIASDLPGNYKQLVKLALDYRATSKGTVTLKIAPDSNTYESTGVMMSLASAPVAGRVEQDVYNGGAFPAIQFESTSTGIELHRVDLTMQIGGRR